MKIVSKKQYQRILSAGFAFVLALSTATASLPFITNQAVDAAPMSSATVSAGFNSLGWIKDRTQPYAYSKTASELRFEVNNTATNAPNSSTFYKWEGFKSNTNLPANTDTVRASLYIDPSWANKPVDASMWATTTNGTDSAWPMIGFANGYTGSYSYTPGDFVGFRVYDTNTGIWHNVVDGASYLGQTVDLEIAINELTNQYEFYLNGNKIYSYDADGYTNLTNVTFNNLNLKTDNVSDNYVVRWTNFYTGTLTPSAPLNGHFTHAGTGLDSGSIVNFSDVRLEWDTYNVPARYRVTAHNPDGTTTNFQPSTNSSWNPASIGWNLNDLMRQGYFGTKGEGVYTYTLAIQNNGIWSAESAPLTLSFDNSAPTINYITPSSNNQVLTSSDSIKIEFNDAVELGQTTVHGYKDGTTPVPSIWQHPLVDGKTKTITLPLTGLSEGVYQIRAAATDEAGHKTQINRNFKIDNTAPTITVKDGYVGNKISKIFSNVSFSLYDAQQVDKYVLNTWTSDFTNNNWSDANFGNIKSHLVQGSNTLTVYDVAGNSTAYTFIYDNVAPTGALSYSPSTLTKNNVTVTLTTSEPIEQSALTGTWNKVSDTVYKKVFPVNATQVQTLKDAAGNIGSATVTIDWIDKTAPDVPTLVSPVNGFVTKGALVTQSWSDGSDDVDHYIYESYNDADANQLRWHEEFSTTSKSATNVADTTYWWRVKAVDHAGNVSEWSPLWKVIVDNTMPVVAITSPLVNLTNGNVEVRATVTDVNLRHYWFQIKKDGVVIKSQTVLSSGITDELLQTLTDDGVYTITVAARDLAGGTSTSGNRSADVVKTVTIDHTAPIVNLVDFSTNGNVITPNLTADDTDNSYTYSWSDLAPNVTASDLTVLNPDFTVNTDGTYISVLTVTDAAGNQTEYAFNYTYTTPSTDDNSTDGDNGSDGNNNGGTTTNNGFGRVAFNNTPANSDANNDDTDVKGASTENDQKVLGDETSNTDTKKSNAAGMAWYWWVLIVAAILALLWAILAAIRRRRADA